MLGDESEVASIMQRGEFILILISLEGISGAKAYKRRV